MRNRKIQHSANASDIESFQPQKFGIHNFKTIPNSDFLSWLGHVEFPEFQTQSGDCIIKFCTTTSLSIFRSEKLTSSHTLRNQQHQKEHKTLQTQTSPGYSYWHPPNIRSDHIPKKADPAWMRLRDRSLQSRRGTVWPGASWPPGTEAKTVLNFRAL